VPCGFSSGTTTTTAASAAACTTLLCNGCPDAAPEAVVQLGKSLYKRSSFTGTAGDQPLTFWCSIINATGAGQIAGIVGDIAVMHNGDVLVVTSPTNTATDQSTLWYIDAASFAAQSCRVKLVGVVSNAYRYTGLAAGFHSRVSEGLRDAGSWFRFCNAALRLSRHAKTLRSRV
jgi:hypothetical protein